MEQTSATRTTETHSSWPAYDAAELGFRNYWYPVMASKALRNKPVAITLCGEKIVLMRDKGVVRALKDRCPHRGVPLSLGHQIFPGTLTCIYHGWTFDLASGALKQALTDGPDSAVCRDAEVCVKTYPAEERANLIWVYVGDEPRPPIEDDIPEVMLADDAVVEPLVDFRKGNWRYAMENACDEAHAKYLHRYTPFYFFSRFAAWQTDVRLFPSEDGKWLNRSSKPVFDPVAYPGLGNWPPPERWRKFRRKPGKFAARLPGIFVHDHLTWQDFQFFVPVDRDHHLTLQISMMRTKGLSKLLWKLRYWLLIRPLHHVLLNRREDGLMVENMSSPPEWLFRPDISIIAWRRWCEQRARRLTASDQAPLQAGAMTAEKEATPA